MLKTANEIANSVFNKIAIFSWGNRRGSGTVSGRNTEIQQVNFDDFKTLKQHPEIEELGVAVNPGFDHMYLFNKNDIQKTRSLKQSNLGYIAASKNSSDDGREIVGLYVNPEHRGRDYGGALLSAMTQLNPDTKHWVKPDPFRDKNMSPEALHKYYVNQGWGPGSKPGTLKYDSYNDIKLRRIQFLEQYLEKVRQENASM